MLKNSWTHAVSVAINISTKLCFVSVNGPRETYFVDGPRNICQTEGCSGPETPFSHFISVFADGWTNWHEHAEWSNGCFRRIVIMKANNNRIVEWQYTSSVVFTCVSVWTSDRAWKTLVHWEEQKLFSLEYQYILIYVLWHWCWTGEIMACVLVVPSFALDQLDGSSFVNK
jgi:hypothetical protein